MLRAALAAAGLVLGGRAAGAACGPEALGTARVLRVPVTEGAVGSISYKHSLPLARGEVVLTFDDGPMPHRTPAVLDALARECAKATFFVVGEMVAHSPDLLHRIAEEGHTVATHSWSHAYLDRTRSEQTRRDQIGGGLLAAGAALGEGNPALSPFFRFPGLGRTAALDGYVADKNLIAMSADIVGDDWHRISPEQVLDRVMRRLDERGRGIILLHDIQPRTVAIVPALLRRLKAGGYRVVHLVPEARDTQIALALAEPPRNARIQVALARLDAGSRQVAALAVARAGESARQASAIPAPVVTHEATAGEPALVPAPMPELAPAPIVVAALAAAPEPALRTERLDPPSENQTLTSTPSSTSPPLPARAEQPTHEARPIESVVARAPVVTAPPAPPASERHAAGVRTPTHEPAVTARVALVAPSPALGGFVVLDARGATARFTEVTAPR